MERVLEIRVPVGAGQVLEKILAMSTTRLKIVVAERCPTTLTNTCTWLIQEGYSVFPCTDAYKALRLARQLLPTLLLLDVSLNGMNTRQLIHIIEADNLSHVILLSNADNNDMRSLLAATLLKIQIHKPIEEGRFLSLIQESLSLLHEKKKRQLLQERKYKDQDKAWTIESAKSILMNKWHLSEDQSYAYIRKMSMDNCISIYDTSKAIMKRNPP